ncbi:hypothetical protein A3K93_14050 (plasmid) [Acinetobacter sp. NCu2D-2]|uniref:hypothetical protein n=1 Tax=Acinetobacter sp. NCu2D-2 TaxID=1608473 RepID=UPI0007CDCB48|nr:hypothetical protein [Acinetobacter sp. NCu2D-2]ANF83351.1 hypothetical protein A3K93_14050 [Acinetobacter sp. NCu2D-2]
MNLFDTLKHIPHKSSQDSRVPHYLYGAFRRKSISFHNGLTDEKTIVYWFQSKSFTIDLRLKTVTDTAITERQGWIGDTLWDKSSQLLSWEVKPYANYQNHVQWPEPAKLHVIGNSILEFSPSNVYVEDWRQQATDGLFLGLRLKECIDQSTGEHLTMDGGLIICGSYIAFALSRIPEIQQKVASLDFHSCEDQALSAIESFEVSISTNGQTKQFTTSEKCYQTAFNFDGFTILEDGSLAQDIQQDDKQLKLIFEVDVFEPSYQFSTSTVTLPAAQDWLKQEQDHLMHHAEMVL